MGSFLEHYDPLARLLLQTLLNALWQGALIVALAALFLRLAGRMSAATRHAIWFVSLLTIAALPFLPASAQRVTLPASAAISGQPQTAAPTPVGAEEAEQPGSSATEGAAGITSEAATIALTKLPAVSEAVAAVSAPAAEAAVPAPAASALQRWSVELLSGRAPLVLVALWLPICALMLGRILWSYLCLFRLRRSLRPLPDLQRRRMGRLAMIFGLKRRVRIRTSPAAAMPMTIGVLWPLIIVPEDLSATLSEAEFESIVAHELAHIKRWDYATNLCQRLIQAYLFFHPAVWLISKQLLIERELACDDWAVKLTGEPRRYASCLTRLAELLRTRKPLTLATGIIFGKHVVSRRIEMILNTDRNATTSVSKPALLYALGMAFCFISVYSVLSPVIAVPITQSQAARADQQATAAPVQSQPSAQPSSEAPVVVAVAPLAPISVRARLKVPTAPLPPVILSLPSDDDEEMQPMQPRPFAIPVLAPRSVSIPMQVALWPQQDAQITPTTQTIWQQPAPAGSGRGLSGERSDTPVIPEAELIALLSDIVKRDADPGVRNEALQGLYRLRTDASVNALIELYDAVADVKMKGDILGNLVRRQGDNSKAIAKFVAVAKTEKDETLRVKALNHILSIKGEEGATHLIAVYDSLTDAKTKERVIRALAYNKSRKAVDKLIQIAKTDSDPAVRQIAVRSLYGIDQKIYIELLERARGNISYSDRMLVPHPGQLTAEEPDPHYLLGPRMPPPAAPSPGRASVPKAPSATTPKPAPPSR
jgi:beta-lactamase regulating signal transducer with metallopeptidase domain